MTTEVEAWDRAFLWRFRAKWLAEEYADGDTFTALPDTGYNGREEVSIRLFGFWAPERRAPGGPEATALLRLVLAEADPGLKWNLRIVSRQLVRVVSEQTTFERYVSDVSLVLPGGEMVDVVKRLRSLQGEQR